MKQGPLPRRRALLCLVCCAVFDLVANLLPLRRVLAGTQHRCGDDSARKGSRGYYVRRFHIATPLGRETEVRDEVAIAG